MSDIFISYKREEQAIAKKLANALEKQNWTVWWDPMLRAGERFDDVIETALEEAKCVIVIWSKLSVSSRYVKDEATYALNLNKLAPVAIEVIKLPFRFAAIHTPQLLDWDGSEDAPDFRRLVGDISAIVGRPIAKSGEKKVSAEREPIDKPKRGSKLKKQAAANEAKHQQVAAGLNRPDEYSEPSSSLHPRYRINNTEFLKQYKEVMRSTIDEGQVFALNKLIDAINRDTSVKDLRWAAYMLATIRYECGPSFRPVEEKGVPDSFKKYDFRPDLGNTQKGDGYRYRGRGYIQITGRSNYRRMTDLLRLSDDDDLEKYPENALKPEIAYMILSSFLLGGAARGQKLSDYLSDSMTDYRGARKLITGSLNRADEVAEQARLFEIALHWAREQAPG